MIKDIWAKREGPVVLTTISRDHIPNSIYASCVKQLEDGRIVVADNYFSKTRVNIAGGSSGALLFMTDENKAYQVKGKIEYLKHGPIYDDMREWVDQKHPRVAAAVIGIDELYTGAERLI